MKTLLLVPLFPVFCLASVTVPPLPKSSSLKATWVNAAIVREEKIIELEKHIATLPPIAPSVGITAVFGPKTPVRLAPALDGLEEVSKIIYYLPDGPLESSAAPFSVQWKTPDVPDRYVIFCVAVLKDGSKVYSPSTVIEVVK